MFARAVVGEPDLLLLDEPTNHLDLATLRIFEAFLQKYRGGFVLVSHDRAFLDAVVGTTWFLRDGRLSCFDLPFSAARAALEEQDDAARRTRAAEERRIESLRASAKRLAIWGRVYDNEIFETRQKHGKARGAAGRGTDVRNGRLAARPVPELRQYDKEVVVDQLRVARRMRRTTTCSTLNCSDPAR